jgi:lysozyme family protein
MAQFKPAYDKTLIAEGQWSDQIDDPGGETMNGVSRIFFPSWSGWDIVDSVKVDGAPQFDRLTPAQKSSLDTAVEEFYRKNFWNRIQGDRIPDSLQSIADELFDTAVNMDVPKAVRFLQSALNVLNRNGKSYADIPEDGIMGGTTLNSMQHYDGNAEETQILLKVMNILQGAKYVEIMKNSPAMERFARGWVGRRVKI